MKTLKELTGRSLRTKDEIYDYVIANGLFVDWSAKVLELVQARTPFNVSVWSPRCVWASEYKSALQSVLNEKGN